MQTEIETKGLRGLGGGQWETMDGVDFDGLLKSLGSSFGMSINDAMKQSVFMLCCDILAQDCGKANLYLRKKINNSSSSIVKPSEHGLAKMFALDPNARHTWSEFVEMVVYWMATMSNGYILVQRRRNGDITKLIPLQTWHVNPLVNTSSSEVFYEVTASSDLDLVLFGFRSKRIPERDIIHVRRRMMNGFDGMPTLQLGASTLQTSANYEKYRDELATEAGQMRGVFLKKGPGAISEQAFNRLQSQLTELMRQYVAKKKPIILEDEIEFQSTSANANDSELSKQFEAQIVQVCRLLRIPPHKAMHFVNIKYENMEVQEKSYIGDTLDPLLKAVEQRLTRHLLDEEDRMAGYFIEFDRSDLTLRDPKVLIETTKAMYSLGSITMGQFLEAHGHEPGPFADHRLIPNNSTLVDGKLKPAFEVTRPAMGGNANPDDDNADAKKHLRLVGAED